METIKHDAFSYLQFILTIILALEYLEGLNLNQLTSSEICSDNVSRLFFFNQNSLKSGTKIVT